MTYTSVDISDTTQIEGDKHNDNDNRENTTTTLYIIETTISIKQGAKNYYSSTKE